MSGIISGKKVVLVVVLVVMSGVGSLHTACGCGAYGAVVVAVIVDVVSVVVVRVEVVTVVVVRVVVVVVVVVGVVEPPSTSHQQ
jgi:hypothetical protein